MEMLKVCCVTGHRPQGFPWDYYDTESISYQEYIESMACFVGEAIRKQKVNYFIAGGAIGADSDFAEIVLGLRDSFYDHIKLEIAVPCPNQDKYWSDKEKQAYAKLLKRADKVTYVSDKYTNFCMQKRNQYMVDHSDIVFAFWNENKKSGGTYNTIQYAKQKNKQLELFVLNNY